MAIPLTEGFRNLSVGPGQVLEITASAYDERLATAKVTFSDGRGRCTETFRFGKGPQRSRGQEVALDIYSTLAKAALNDWTVESIEPEDLVGRLVKADVYADEVENEKTGAVSVYIHVRNFSECPEE